MCIRDRNADWDNGGIGYKVKTRLRRHLSEFRDNYVSQSDFLYKNAIRIKQHLKREKKLSSTQQDGSQS